MGMCPLLAFVIELSILFTSDLIVQLSSDHLKTGLVLHFVPFWGHLVLTIQKLNN
jgi:hypothetical protein